MSCFLMGSKNKSSDVSARIYHSVRDLPQGDWDENVCEGHLFLTRSYLAAVENWKDPVCYLLFYKADRPVGIAVFQVATFTGVPLRSYIKYHCAFLSFVTRPFKWVKKPLVKNMIVCGSPFVAGQHGYCFSKDLPADEAAAALAVGAKVAKAQLDRKLTTDGILLKEFYPASKSFVQTLKSNRYTDFETEPAMILPIDSQWHNFEDYLASLASKYRVKAKRTHTLSAQLIYRDLTYDDLVEYQHRIEQLYKAVSGRANFRLGGLDTKALMGLRQSLGTNFVLKGYFLKKRLVGFLMGFVNGDTLEAGFVGIDYTLNKTHGIYPRMLYDYLKCAMEYKLKAVNFGRTAGEIKSTLGAVPVALNCCVHLGKAVWDTVLPAFSNTVHPSDFALRKPFKKNWYLKNGTQMSPLLMGGLLVSKDRAS